MTKAEQKEMIRGLSTSVAESICEQIDKGLIPESWDGHELRALLSYRHGLSAAMSDPMKNKRGKRHKDFQNTIIVNNL